MAQAWSAEVVMLRVSVVRVSVEMAGWFSIMDV